jgi:cytochrome c oxidase assembly protein subunit 15
MAAGAFGRLVVLSGLATWLGAVDLFCALTAMTVMGVAAVMAGAPAADSASRSAAEPHPVRISRLAGLSVTVLVVMHVTGIFAAGTGSYTRCMGWPLWRLIAGDPHPWLQGLRLGLAGLGAALVVTTAMLAARSERLRRWGIVLASLFGAEMVLGLVIRARGLDDGVAAAYSVLAVALLWCLGLLTAVARAARVAPDAAPLQPAPARGELAEPGRR